MKYCTNRRCVASLALMLAVAVGCGRSGKEAAPEKSPTKQADAAGASSAVAAAPTGQPEISADEILRRMADAYRHAASYADAGKVRISGELDGQPVNDESNFTAAMVRPNKILLQMGGANVVCDGKTIRGTAVDVPGCVLERPAPDVLAIETLLGDAVLDGSLAQMFTKNYSWFPPQVVLLLARDPLVTLLHGATKRQLLAPEKIDQYDCHRVEITRPDGKAVFWIDRNSYALRRLEYPVEAIKMMTGAKPDSKWSLVADFTEAQLGQPVDPKAFEFAMPPDARSVAQLMPGGVELLGKRSNDFIFVGEDGKPVTLTSLSGRIAVIAFWAAGDQASRETLPQLQELHDRYKDNPKVQCLVVSVDPATVPTAELRKAFDALGVKAPLLRDAEKHAAGAFRLMALPCVVVLGAEGEVQAYLDRGHMLSAAMLGEIVEKLLAGRDVFPEGQEAFTTMATEYGRLFGEMIRRDLFLSPMEIQQELLRSPIAERSEPTVLKLSRLWSCATIEAPGNAVAVVEPDGGTRILVPSAGRAIVELDGRGAVVTRHELGLPAEEYVAFVRTGLGADGRRHYVGTAPGMQQFHVFDQDWKLVLSFPADARKNPHAGIGDVQLADFNGDGKLEIAAGYLGVVGVKGVSLSGEVLWSQRAVANVFKTAFGGPAGDGRRPLFCTNDQYTLATLDDQGKIVGRVNIPKRLLYWIAAADLARDGRTTLCGLSASLQGDQLAVGLTPGGELAWNYDLPKGAAGNALELVVPAWFRVEGPGQWILVGADGSLHFVSADGKPIDRFNYGEVVLGVAFAQLDGKPAIIVSTASKVEAWSVVWPE